MRARTALGVGLALAGSLSFATADDPVPAPRFEVHEIGYLDLNQTESLEGWLKSIPKSTPVQVRTVTDATRGWRTDMSRASRPNDPALLFHAQERVQVRVRVGFRRGAPVAWWPAGEVVGQTLDFGDVLVDPRAYAPRPTALDVIRYPGLIPLRHIREAGATPVWVQGKKEGALVYEGVLPFQPEIAVREVEAGRYSVHNRTGRVLHDVILIPAAESSRGILVGTVEPGTTVEANDDTISPLPLATVLDLQLGRSGLFAGEVKALRRTLLSLDFTSGPGVRLLARLPKATWDEAFPVTITPAPRQFVRVGVLRIFDATHYTPQPMAPLPPETRPTPAPTTTPGVTPGTSPTPTEVPAPPAGRGTDARLGAE